MRRLKLIAALGLALSVATVGLASAQGQDVEAMVQRILERVRALASDPLRQTAFTTTSELPDPPPGQITVQLRIRYQGDPLPGDGIVFHETVPETEGLFTMASLPPGAEVPAGPPIEDGIVFVKPGDRLKTELVFQNPTDQDIPFAAVPWYAEPAFAHLGITNQCFCASVPWFAPAGGSWYRTIYTDFDPWIPPGTKMAIVWTVVTDPEQFALLPGETVDELVERFNNFPGAEETPAEETPAEEEAAPKAVKLNIVGKDIQFDKAILSVAPDTPFVVVFDHQDEGIPHNFAIYTEPGGDLIAKTEIETGPVVQRLEVDGLAAGTYYYQCDVHPATMTGSLEVG